MMRFFIPLICLFTLFSCSKEKRYTKAIKGAWQIQLVKYQDNEGFSFYDEQAVGSLVIGDNQLVNGAIYSSFIGNSGQLTDSFQVAGHYFLNLKNEEINFVLGQDTLITRLFLLTNTDLEFEYYNALKSKRVRYIFKKI
ncbi:MAG: hypothetical protein NT109_10430 [Flavobacteriia bacterium]|nr:hypothetical protein [Flavobacteriia bacterium]